MLSRSQRLSVEQFEKVMKNGRVTSSSLFIVYALAGQAGIRIAAAAPKKVAALAVGRNRIRRQIYEAIRPIIVSVKPGTHAIVFAKAGINEKSVAEMTVELKNIFVKADLLR